MIRFGLEAGVSWLLLAVVWLYRLTLGPLLGPRCRFLPTCSEYAIEALKQHGPWRGSLLTGRRILRCHPWGSSGYDPVPGKNAQGECAHGRGHPAQERAEKKVM